MGASLVHIVFHPNSLTPVIGASGAVSGIMGAYLILYPSAKVRTLVFIFFFITFVDIPAAVFLIVWFIFQFLYVGGQGVAWLAHVGGFVLGLLLINASIRGDAKEFRRIVPEAMLKAEKSQRGEINPNWR